MLSRAQTILWVSQSWHSPTRALVHPAPPGPPWAAGKPWRAQLDTEPSWARGGQSLGDVVGDRKCEEWEPGGAGVGRGALG